METDTIIYRAFMVETVVTVTRHYQVELIGDENPWDMWEEDYCSSLIDKTCSEEKAVSVERIRED